MAHDYRLKTWYEPGTFGPGGRTHGLLKEGKWGYIDDDPGDTFSLRAAKHQANLYHQEGYEVAVFKGNKKVYDPWDE